MKNLILPLFLLSVICHGQDVLKTNSSYNYMPNNENLKARKCFQDAKFGMFIHWGIYSVLGSGEWVMNTQCIDKKNYEKLSAFFNPTEFNAAEWVALAKTAGMKYITITSKHHDGFAIFDSKLTDWDIVDRTVYKKDIIELLADECKKQGIKLFLYYSQLDWYQNDYFPKGETGLCSNRPEGGNWNKYLDFMDGQLKELLTNYGEIGGIWFDGWWDKKSADWKLEKTYKLIHDLQPQCLIGSNHHQTIKPGEDLQMFEKDLPGFNTAGFSNEAKVGDLPLETCETMNDSWGFNLKDNSYKSVKEIIRYYVKAAGYNANFLLNIGPMPNGKIQPEFIDTLKSVGRWNEEFGETIYGTRGGPITPRVWGVTTCKGNKIFVHILDWLDSSLTLPLLSKKVLAVKLFSDRSGIEFIENKFGLTLQVPSEKRNSIDTIIEIELAAK